MTDIEQRLELLADYFQYWRDWNARTRAAEGLSTTNHTAIICVPPHWPDHGAISHWIETLREAKAAIAANTAAQGTT